MSIRLITAFVISVLFATLFGRFYVPWLRRQKAGQEIREDGPTWHSTKAGTPTMGGVIFILASALGILTVGFADMLQGQFLHFFVFLFALAFGAIGFLDDWEKLKKKQNLGLTAKMKFLLQLAAALLFVVLMERFGIISSRVYIPFFNRFLTVPRWLYYIASAFIICGTVNAVNITDGIDGLAAGTSIPVFLFYNFNPARVFMGDTGSLFLGGALAAMAFAYDMPLILVTLGFVFLVETLSDIIQVTYFKLTHGKRVFKMAPFHHHLELGGWTGKKWKEKELFCLFTGVSLFFAILSFLGVAGRTF